MYQGKHSSLKEKFKVAASCRKRRVSLILSLVLILTVAIGGTLAYFIDVEWSTSHFAVGKVSCTVAVAEDNSSVTVTNTGNVPAKIRVAVIANWVNDEGIHYTQPELVIGDAAWTISGNDGFYYYNSVVEADGYINLPIVVNGDAPSGYSLQIQALAEAIQENADAWVYAPIGN